ncbi:hypothetical protein AUP68_10602 [Ilyonectria robusta]
MIRANFSSFSIANAESMDLPYFSMPIVIFPSYPIRARQSARLDRRMNATMQYPPTDGCFRPPDDSLEPPPNPKTGNSYTVSPAEYGIPVNTSRSERSELPELLKQAEDDSAMMKPGPWRLIDYLSHDWKEEDIWSSWKGN